MSTHEELRRIRALRLEEDMLGERIARLQSAMQRCTTSPPRDGAGGSAEQDKLAAQLAQKAELEAKLRACALAAANAQLAAHAQLAALPPAQQEVMALRYIKGLPWSQVARQAHYSQANCFKLHALSLRTLDADRKE